MTISVAHAEECCYLCGSRRLYERHARAGGRASDAGAFRCTCMNHGSKPRVVACEECGLEYVPADDVPAGLADLYAGVVDETYLKYEDARRKTFETVHRRIAPHLPEGRGTLLEVGCYTGVFLDVMRSAGWKVTGVEPSKWAADFARGRRNLDVRTGTLDECGSLPRGGFDAVFMWDVLEHLRDPERVLRQAHALLRPDGVLCLSTLDVKSWFPRLAGRRWPWLMEMHLFYFSKPVMERFFAKTGFRMVEARPYRHYISARYFAEKLVHLAPPALAWLPKALRWVTPRGIFVPFQLGDIKLFVARRASRPEAEQAAPCEPHSVLAVSESA
ncbi:MAG: class I SAM-dependent methyltransferase [Planctomycetes bacterium]|nr:class I SAM-dependent methyltransferase [Planctomycetota bacterium]